MRGLVAGLAIWALVASLWFLGAFRYIEWVTLDARFLYRFIASVDHAPTPVTVVAIDEKAINEWGNWPWPRSLQAELIAAILDANPSALGIDILYTTFAADRSEDQRFAAALANATPIVLAAARGAEAELLPLVDFVADNVTMGHINSPTDFDGVMRRLPHHINTSRGSAFTLSWEMALRVAERQGTPPPELPPLDGDGAFLINFRPRLDAPLLSVDAMTETVSIFDVANGRDLDKIEGRAVIVGVTAAGVDGLDQHLTPLRPLGQIPGVYLHAAALASILDGAYIHTQSGLVFAAALLVCSVLAGVALFLLRPWPATIVTVLGVAGYMIMSVWYFRMHEVWIEVTPVVTAFLFAYVGGLWHAHVYVDGESRHLRSAFRRYVAPEVVDALLVKPSAAQIEGGRREITVLFADIRGFTSFSEGVPPERVVAILNRYLGLMAESVLIHGGMVDKFIGDGTMAIFGAPLPTENHAERAVNAALHILRQVEVMRNAYQGPRLSVGIGIHTGEAVVGSIGSSARLDYTAVGDAVNIAARLQELAKPGTIMMSRETMSRLPDDFPIRATSLKPVTLRGRTDPISLFEAVPEAPEVMDVPDHPEGPDVPGVPDSPDASGAPERSGVPENRDIRTNVVDHDQLPDAR